MFDDQGGTAQWIGTHSFSNEYCQNFVRLYPAEAGTHISELIEDSYHGPQKDFEWYDLASDPPETILGTDTSEEDGTGDGMTSFFFATAEQPALLWVQRVAISHPSVNIVYDYQRESTELLGRVMFTDGHIYKQCHLSPVPDLLTMERRDRHPAGRRRPSGLLTLVEDSPKAP